MNLEEIMLKEAMKKIDLSEYTPQLEEAIKAYFDSDEFIDAILEALNDEGLGWDIGKELAKKFSKELKKLAIQVSL